MILKRFILILQHFSTSSTKEGVTMNNALYGKPTNWVGDGSGDGTIHVNEADITLASATTGTPFNVFDDVNLGNGNNDQNVAYYFEGTITELDGSLSFGVVAKDEVAPGWKTRGMFYNGNLTNGSAALLTGFGKYIKVGDKVGVLCDAKTNTTKLYYYINDQCLGLAFDIPNTKRQYLPCLHVTGSAKINLAVPAELPPQRDRNLSPSGDDKYQGQWNLSKAFYGPELGKFPLPDNHIIIASFEKQDASSSYQFGIKVGNSMGTKITLTGKKFEGGFDEVTIGPIRSTMMMPPPELQFVENELIGKGLPVVNKMIVTSTADEQKNLLLMQGPTIELELVPYVATFEPLSSYQ
jgi:hypothetical protein